jgi:hypothetical protein
MFFFFSVALRYLGFNNKWQRNPSHAWGEHAWVNALSYPTHKPEHCSILARRAMWRTILRAATTPAPPSNANTFAPQRRGQRTLVLSLSIWGRAISVRGMLHGLGQYLLLLACSRQQYDSASVYDTGVIQIKIQTTVFDPAVCLGIEAHTDEASTQQASFFQKRPVVSVKETYSAGFPHTLPAGF